MTIGKILGPLRIMLDLLCPLNGTATPGGRHICLHHGLLGVLSPLLRPAAQEKKKTPFKILLLVNRAPGRPRALTEVTVGYMKVVLMLANTASILQATGQGGTSTRKSNLFKKFISEGHSCVDSDAFWTCYCILIGLQYCVTITYLR